MTVFEYFKKIKDTLVISPELITEGNDYKVTSENYVSLFGETYEDMYGNVTRYETQRPSVDPTHLVFDNTYEVKKDIAKRAARYYYDSNVPIHDIADISASNYNNDVDFPLQIPKDGLRPLGIKTITIPDEASDNYIYINIEHFPTFEALVLENFIIDCCMDDIIEELSNLTPYLVYKKEIPSIGNVICVEDIIANIRTIDQLKIFIKNEYAKSLYLLNGEIGTMTISKDIFNIPKDSIPPILNIEITLEKIWSADAYYAEQIIESISCQVVQNMDWSISFIPQPSQIQDVIYRQLELWSEYTHYTYDNYWIAPDGLEKLIEFMIKYNLKSPHGFVSSIIKGKDAIELATYLDNKRHEDGFTYNTKLPCSIYDFISGNFILVRLNK